MVMMVKVLYDAVPKLRRRPELISTERSSRVGI